MKTRIYEETIDINSESVKSFWEKRASENSLKSVLLGAKFPANSAVLRNEKELNLLIDYFKNKQYSLLDLGCGCARWADNLKDYLKSYTGVDFSSEFIKNNKKRFSNYKNFEFINMPITALTHEILSKEYDFIIATGILMYLNDGDLDTFFKTIKSLNTKYIYLQESISVINVRLTLANFYSEELKEKYNAIYRKSEDYEFYIFSILNNYKIIKQGLLLDEKTGAREETNACYWLCEREDL